MLCHFFHQTLLIIFLTQIYFRKSTSFQVFGIPEQTKVLPNSRTYQLALTMCHVHIIYKLFNWYLTDGIFETGAYGVPRKSQNPTVSGQGCPSSTQCSNPSWACRWHHPFGTNSYPPFGHSTKNQVFSHALDFYFLLK